MAEFGKGLSLDKNFDLQLSSVGDIDSEEGIDELQKDLAVQVAFTLRNIIGQPDSPELASEIRSRSRKVIEADERVNEVIRGSIRIQRFERGRNEVRYSISVEVSTESGTEELVFEIEE